MSRDTRDDAGLAKLTGLLLIGGIAGWLASGEVLFLLAWFFGIGMGLWFTSKM